MSARKPKTPSDRCWDDYEVGDKIEYQTEAMAEPRRAIIVKVRAGGWDLDDGAFVPLTAYTSRIATVRQLASRKPGYGGGAVRGTAPATPAEERGPSVLPSTSAGVPACATATAGRPAQVAASDSAHGEAGGTPDACVESSNEGSGESVTPRPSGAISPVLYSPESAAAAAGPSGPPPSSSTAADSLLPQPGPARMRQPGPDPTPEIPPAGPAFPVARASATSASAAALTTRVGITVPESLDGLTEAIANAIHEGRRHALLIAVYIAHARDQYFTDDAPGWLRLMAERFGYARRFCFQCLTVGRAISASWCTLPETSVRRLLDTDIQKLEQVAHLPESQQPEFIAHVPTESLSRKQLRDKVALWGKGSDGSVGSDGSTGQAKTAKPGTTAAVRGPLGAILMLSGLSDEQVPAAAIGADAMLAFRAGFAGLAIALAASESVRLTDAQREAIRTLLDQTVAEVGKLLERE